MPPLGFLFITVTGFVSTSRVKGGLKKSINKNHKMYIKTF